jgi:hypothetical protein
MPKNANVDKVWRDTLHRKALACQDWTKSNYQVYRGSH